MYEKDSATGPHLNVSQKETSDTRPIVPLWLLLKSEAGTMLIGQMAVLLILCTMALFTTMALLNSKRGEILEQRRFSVKLIRDKLVSLVTQHESWNLTLKDPLNSSFSCVLNASEICNSNQTYPVRIIKDAAGNTVLDTQGENYAFTLDGIPCRPDSENVTTCLIVPTVTWRALCPAVCTNPAIEVRVNFTLLPEANDLGLRMNTEALSFIAIHNP